MSVRDMQSFARRAALKARSSYRSVRRRDRVRGFVRPRADGHYELISADPVVIYAADAALFGPDPAIYEVLDAVSSRSIYLLVTPWWHIGDNRLHQFVTAHDRLRARYPRDEVPSRYTPVRRADSGS